MALAQPEVDLHVHTVASGHAYSTITEIAVAAAARGLRGIGMSDHGPALPGGPHYYHFNALRFVPPTLHGVRIFKGVEANILGPGRLDLPEETLALLEVVMAGFHEECGFGGGTCAENTAILAGLMTTRKVHVITHPGNPLFPVDYEEIAQVAAKTGVALEINNASFTLSRTGSSGNCQTLASHCARFGTPVAVGSDAHIACGVGEFDAALAALAAAGVQPGQIVNRTLASTLAFLGLRA